MFDVNFENSHRIVAGMGTMRVILGLCDEITMGDTIWGSILTHMGEMQHMRVSSN